jgi:prophage regulatory protein
MQHQKILRLKDVIERTGLARSTIYLYISRGQFPRPVNIGHRAVGWLEAEVEQWLASKIAGRASTGAESL